MSDVLNRARGSVVAVTVAIVRCTPRVDDIANVNLLC